MLQINCHFHFLNFPTVSSLLHIREILVHWPSLEISGPQKMGCKGHFGPQAAEFSGWNTDKVKANFQNMVYCGTVEKFSIFLKKGFNLDAVFLPASYP